MSEVKPLEKKNMMEPGQLLQTGKAQLTDVFSSSQELTSDDLFPKPVSAFINLSGLALQPLDRAVRFCSQNKSKDAFFKLPGGYEDQHVEQKNKKKKL